MRSIYIQQKTEIEIQNFNKEMQEFKEKLRSDTKAFKEKVKLFKDEMITFKDTLVEDIFVPSNCFKKIFLCQVERDRRKKIIKRDDESEDKYSRLE